MVAVVYGHEFSALSSICKLDKRLRIDVQSLNLVKGSPSVKFFVRNTHFKFCGILLFKIGNDNHCAMVISQHHVMAKSFPALTWPQYVDFVVTLRPPDDSDGEFLRYEAEQKKNNPNNPITRGQYGRFGLQEIMVNGTSQIIFKPAGPYVFFQRRVT